MKIEEFITESLVSVASGIETAAKKLAERNSTGIVNPKDVSPNYVPNTPHFGTLSKQNRTGQPVLGIAFDIAVTAEEGKQAKGSAGIRIAGVGIGGDAASDTRSTAISRIKFTIPMLLPYDERKV